MSGNRVAVVVCVHHKPWLVMSTIITALLQDYQDVDFHFVYQMGDGACLDKASYREYHELAAQYGVDRQLSPYDPRVRDVCMLNGRHVFDVEFENDSALDSGAWYKFIRTGVWRAYEHVLFVGEGTLLARTDTLSSALAMCARGADFITSGHEKRRLPKELVAEYNSRGNRGTPMNAFHDRMIQQTFDLFSRDPEFAAVYDRWTPGIAVETQNHVPDIFTGDPFDRFRRATSVRGAGKIRAVVRSLIQQADGLRAGLAVASGVPEMPAGEGVATMPIVHVNGQRRPVDDVVQTVREGAARFHAVKEPEWYGCAVIHLMSRAVLERFAAKLEQFHLYEVLDVPFSGTALELVWGMVPAWLGVTKWFTDGFHRVRKDFITDRREDDPATVASYINRYYRGVVHVAASGPYLTLRSVNGSRAFLPQLLGHRYR